MGRENFRGVLLGVLVVALVSTSPQLRAATLTWTGLTNGNWSYSATDSNWGGTAYTDATALIFPA